MKTIFALIFACLFLSINDVEQEPLTITVTNIKNTKGNIRLGIYTPSNDFPNEKDTYMNKVYKVQQSGKILIKIKDLPYGEYAIGFHHDENKNGTLDKSFIGIPKEPFAFTNNIQPRFKAPDFEECKIRYSKKNHNLSVKLLHY